MAQKRGEKGRRRKGWRVENGNGESGENVRRKDTAVEKVGHRGRCASRVGRWVGLFYEWIFIESR